MPRLAAARAAVAATATMRVPFFILVSLSMDAMHAE
jgi:hypothetical protein